MTQPSPQTVEHERDNLRTQVEQLTATLTEIARDGAGFQGFYDSSGSTASYGRYWMALAERRRALALKALGVRP